MNENLEKPGERSAAETRIALFKGKEIRKTIHNNEWWFVIEDVIAVLTDSMQPKGYIKDMRRRDAELAKGWGQIATPLSLQTAGGVQKLNCANFEQNKDSAQRGGKIAGDARKKLEIESGRKVVTSENYLDAPQNKKAIKDESE